MIAKLSHAEFEVEDGAVAATFFSEVLGWRFEKFSAHYWLYSPKDGSPAIGLLECKSAATSKVCSVFFEVDDLEKRLTTVVSKGGLVVESPTQINNYGRYAKFREPQGNLIGLFSAS